MSKLSASRVLNVADLRRIAKRRVPRAVFDYLDGGADAEVTLRENCRAFEDIIFRPHQAVAMENCNLRTTVLGQEISFPAMLAPVGYSRLMHPEGEIAAARAAGEAGTGYILSTVSGHKLEDVKAGTKGFAWYQLYLAGGRPAAEGAMDRARRAGFSALVVTIDTAVAGLRERDPRNGVPQLLGKGVFIADDARRAVDEGASAVVVSNHGGRQLDSVSPTIRALPEIVSAVGNQIEVLMDGGVRRGSDIVKALCLGARAVLVGRAYAYGLAAAGHSGVTRAIEILRKDVERTMRLLGCDSVSDLD